MMLPREGYVLSEKFVIVRRFSQTLQAHKLNMIQREKLARHPRTIWRIWACDVTPTSRMGPCPPVVWPQKSLIRCLFPLEWTVGLKMVTINISLNHHDTFKQRRLFALHSVCGIHGLIIEAKWCKFIFVSHVDHDHHWFWKWHVAYSAPNN